MKLHVFNPEHDIALATNVPNYTAPYSARKLRTDIGYMPALWANNYDIILVDNVENSMKSLYNLGINTATVTLVTQNQLADILVNDLDVCPWGWDNMLKYQLIAANKDFERTLPSDETLQKIRTLSNRRWASEHLLTYLTRLDGRLTGVSTYAESMEGIVQSTKSGGKYVLKAPWSGSGRGLRYVELHNGNTWNDVDIYQQKWTKNIIAQQGGIMIEPYYNKVVDFGMEFTSTKNGIIYNGLSIFYTQNGKYTGNIIATEEYKTRILARYIDTCVLNSTRENIINILSNLLPNIYEGALGIDMMIVKDGNINRLHPCVELNLRRTMGHVALAMQCRNMHEQRLLSIEYTDKYCLSITQNTTNAKNKSMW